MVYDPALCPVPASPIFDARSYGARASRVSAGGRQAAWFIPLAHGEGVLRHYQRGGLIARVSKDRYVWQGEEATRAFSECRVMAHLHEAGVSVPAPVAGAYWRHGLTYRAAIITQRIPDVLPLAHALQPERARAVAQAVVRMHRAGAWHADLNAFNILIDPADRVWLIDFDKAVLGPMSEARRLANLSRLARSLKKLAGSRGESFAADVQQHYRLLWQGSST